MMRRHAELLCEHMGEERGLQGVPQARRVVPQGLPRPAASCGNSLALVDSLAALDELLARLDPDEPFPVAELGTPRGRQGSPRARRAPAGLARRHRRHRLLGSARTLHSGRLTAVIARGSGNGGAR